MKITENFELQEFVSPQIYKKFRHKSIIFLDSRLPGAVQALRDKVNMPLIINGKYKKKKYIHSGFRSKLTNSFSWYSQHRFGRAVDIKVKDTNAVYLYRWIMTHQKEVREMGFTTIEKFKYTPTWVHLDMRMLPADHPKDKLLVVSGRSKKSFLNRLKSLFNG